MIRRSCLHRRRARSGALLLEILLSVVIMSVSLGVIIASMTASMRSARFAAQYTQAVMAADTQMTRQIKEERFAGAMPTELEESEEEEASRYDFSVETEGSQESGDIEVMRMVTEWQTGRKNNRLMLSTYSRMAP